LSAYTLEFLESEAGRERMQTCAGVLGYNRESGRIVPLWIAPKPREGDDVVTIIVETQRDLERVIAALTKVRVSLVMSAR
jgi:hypothetical protein